MTRQVLRFLEVNAYECPMHLLLGVGTVGALLVALAAAWGVWRMSNQGPPRQAPAYDDTALRAALDNHLEVLENHDDQLERLRADYKALVVAVDEGIQDVRRRENRIRASVRRAQEELEEHGVSAPSIEAEAAELRELDAERGEELEVPPVREDLAERRAVFGSIPGSFDPEEIGA